MTTANSASQSILSESAGSQRIVSPGPITADGSFAKSTGLLGIGRPPSNT